MKYILFTLYFFLLLLLTGLGIFWRFLVIPDLQQEVIYYRQQNNRLQEELLEQERKFERYKLREVQPINNYGK
mgnify:CR=1 FL=1